MLWSTIVIMLYQSNPTGQFAIVYTYVYYIVQSKRGCCHTLYTTTVDFVHCRSNEVVIISEIRGLTAVCKDRQRLRFDQSCARAQM